MGAGSPTISSGQRMNLQHSGARMGMSLLFAMALTMACAQDADVADMPVDPGEPPIKPDAFAVTVPHSVEGKARRRGRRSAGGRSHRAWKQRRRGAH